MIKKIITISFCIFFISLSLSAQSNHNDEDYKKFEEVGFKDEKEAILYITKYINKYPRDANAYSERGFFLYFEGQYDYAIKDYNKAIELDPTNASFYAQRGDFFYSRSNYDLAIQDFNKAIEIQPDWHGFYAKRSECFIRKNDYELALKDINKSIELRAYSLTYGDRAGIYELLYQFDLAILDRTKAIELDSADIYFHMRAETYIRMGEYNLAIQDFTQAIDKGYSQSYVERSNAYRLMKNYDLALLSLTDYFQIEGEEDSYGLYHRGLINIDKGEYELAKKDFNKSIELGSGEYLLLYMPYWGRGKLYHLQKNYTQALEDYNECIGIYETYKDSFITVSDYKEISNVYYSRGTLYYETEKYNEALKDLDQAISLFAVDADYYVNRGNIYYKLGNNDKARADWQKAIELNPSLKKDLEEYLK